MQPPVPPFNDPNQQQGPDSKHEKINTIWKIVSLSYTLIALGICFYWEWKDSGLCIIIREWQGSIMDREYYPALDVLGALIALLLPLFIAKVLIERMTGVKIEKVNYRR